MAASSLLLGRIDYLNIRPLFDLAGPRLASRADISILRGHPAELNLRLRRGEIHVAPCSSFEYLAHAHAYRLLPDIGITAPEEVQSVLFCSPVPLEELPDFLARRSEYVGLTTASATSVALLRILWREAWRLPEPRWTPLAPGTGVGSGMPFLEIGDAALALYADPPQGLFLYDMAAEWRRLTGLPFVFALWIVRRDLTPDRQRLTAFLHEDLLHAADGFRDERVRSEYALRIAGSTGFSQEVLAAYWRHLEYGLSAAALAGLMRFGWLAARLGLLEALPGLCWQKTDYGSA